MYKTVTSGIEPASIVAAGHRSPQGHIQLSLELSTTGDHVMVTMSDWSGDQVKHMTIRLDADRAQFMGQTLAWIGGKVVAQS